MMHSQYKSTMRELTLIEAAMATGGAPGCTDTGSLREPIACPGSEWGRMVNDGARMLNDFGSWLGGKIYDVTHQ